VDRAILAHEVPLEWSYVALERTGAIVLFPGTQGWGPDYDARERTWYTEAMAAWVARREPASWTKPYEDTLGQGLVVTCCQLVLGPSGPAGVAAVDISLQRLMGELDALAGHLPGFRRAALVDQDGTLLVSTGAGAKLVLTPHPDAARLRASSSTDGWFRSDRPGLLLAWSALPRLRWTLVVEVDEAELLRAHAGAR